MAMHCPISLNPFTNNSVLVCIHTPWDSSSRARARVRVRPLLLFQFYCTINILVTQYVFCDFFFFGGGGGEAQTQTFLPPVRGLSENLELLETRVTCVEQER